MQRRVVLSRSFIEGATNFITKEGNLKTAHGNGSFTKDLTAFLGAFASHYGNNQKMTDDFVKRMKNQYGITVTVK